MQTPTITYPADLQPTLPRHFSRKERMAAEHLKESYRNLLIEADHIRASMQAAENHFNFLSGEKELDTCIYRLRSTQCQYAAVLRRMQALQVRMRNLSQES